jgi:RNA polymerase sigma-54 factor
MQLNIGQQMRMGQVMKMAPRMIQSMEILQLPVMALQERIEQERIENPLLEEGPATDGPDDLEFEPGPRDEAPSTTKEVERQELVVGKDENSAADFERLLEMSADWPEDNYASSSSKSSNRIDEESDRKHDAMTNMVSRPQSLQDYMIEQFAYFKSEPLVREFAEYLINSLDADGRLKSTIGEYVQHFGNSVTMDDAQQALRLIQKLDPPGVGARDLKECLLLQVKPETPHREVVVALITEHLEDLAANRLPVIERKTGFSIEEIKEAWEQLRKLDPHPGRGYNAEPNQQVTPDLMVDRDENGNYSVRLIDEYIPQLRISRKYVEMLKANPDAQTREYIKRKVESAKWLIESVEQRQRTLQRVAQSICDHQKEFLDYGPEFIKPLKMQQVAEEVGIHVTTVSRAVDDKWIQTPRGQYPLKRFFGGGTTSAEGEEVAWDRVRLKLLEIVEKEDKNEPLSDDDLVKALEAEGLTLARRTVTKYRKALNIPSSRQRRQY